MKKKNLATAMAAAMTLGAVAPVVANAAEPTAPVAPVVADKNEIQLNSRLASGYVLIDGVKTRTEIYNTNATKDRNDDTLKTAFKDAKIIAEKQDTKDSYNDTFVVAKKGELADINIAKANIETAKAEIEAAKTAGAKVTEKETLAVFGATFTESKLEVTVEAKDKTTKVYVFNGVEGKIETPEVATDLEAIFTGLNDKLHTDVEAGDKDKKTPASWTVNVDPTDKNKANNYADMNRIKYTVEKNIAKFDVQKDEYGVTNENLKVTLLKKGTNNVAVELKFENFAKADKKLVMNIPAQTDFNGHWAEAEIIEGMLNGYVDATGTFRPYDSITRSEFARIACSVFNVTAEDGKEEPFSDVKQGDWFYKYVVALYNKKVDGQPVMQGGGSELFNPNAKITREEVAVIVAKLVDDKAHETKAPVGTDANNKPITVDVDVVTKFKDDKEIATWADESVAFLNTKEYAAGKVIAEGNDGKFMPKNQISRAESLVMIDRSKLAKTFTK